MNPGATTQTAQEFMESYLREKADLIKSDNRNRWAFEEKFYSEEIMKHSYSSWKQQEELLPEVLSVVTDCGDVVKVVTTMPALRNSMTRYHLRIAGERSQICCTEFVCIDCGGSGQTAKGVCSRCGGTGWIDPARELKLWKRR